MTTSVTQFRARFPDQAEYSDERIQLFLDDAANIYMGLNESRWCNNYDTAQAYLAAHLLTVGTATEAGDSSANAGPITSKSAGGVSVSKSVTTKDRSDADDFYMSTSYGQQFLNIRNMCFVPVVIANQL